jgi:hypothetical protein
MPMTEREHLIADYARDLAAGELDADEYRALRASLVEIEFSDEASE